MTDWTNWFSYQLQASADGFVWAFSQINPAWHESYPPEPQYLGTWSPIRHVWHVTEYERCLVIPSMHQWLDGLMPNGNDWHDDDKTWAGVENRSFDGLVAAFRQTRNQQIELLGQFSKKDWTMLKETLWGEKPLSMIVTKTFQHTYEHGDTLLRMGLWWANLLERENREK